MELLPVIEDADAIVADPSLDTFSRNVKGEAISDLQPRLFTGGVLRDYQVKGSEREERKGGGELKGGQIVISSDTRIAFRIHLAQVLIRQRY